MYFFSQKQNPLARIFEVLFSLPKSTIKCIIKQFSFCMNYSFEVYNPNPHKYGLNGFLTLKKLRPLVRFEVAVLYMNVLSFCLQ